MQQSMSGSVSSSFTWFGKLLCVWCTLWLTLTLPMAMANVPSSSTATIMPKSPPILALTAPVPTGGNSPPTLNPLKLGPLKPEAPILKVEPYYSAVQPKGPAQTLTRAININHLYFNPLNQQLVLQADQPVLASLQKETLPDGRVFLACNVTQQSLGVIGAGPGTTKGRN
jgi:hypothetical protein